LIALATSIIVALLLVVPELLQRLIISKIIPLKTLLRSRSEELGRALFSIVIPLYVTIVSVRSWTFLHNWVFSAYSQLPNDSATSDLKTLFSCIASDQIFREERVWFFAALGRIWHSSLWFLLCFYSLCSLISVLMGVATRHYGRLREWSERHWYTKWLVAIWNGILLPKVTFWHALLTPFTLADKSAEIMLDVLVNNGIIYQGLSYQYFLDIDSKLAGIILKNPRRFMRDEYEAEKRESRKQEIDKDSFWRAIPSESLFLTGSSIINLNINYRSKRPLHDVLQKFLSQALNSQDITISITAAPETEAVDARVSSRAPGSSGLGRRRRFSKKP
jgi:hypothetical protein